MRGRHSVLTSFFVVLFFFFLYAAFKLPRRAPLHNTCTHKKHTKVARTAVSLNLINEEFSQLKETWASGRVSFEDGGNCSAALLEGKSIAYQNIKETFSKNVQTFPNCARFLHRHLTSPLKSNLQILYSDVQYETKNLFRSVLLILCQWAKEIKQISVRPGRSSSNAQFGANMHLADGYSL